MKRSISLNEFWIRIFGITELIEYLRTKVSIGHLISEYEYLFRLGLSARISPDNEFSWQDRNRLYNASYMKALILLESGTVPRLEVADLPIPTPGTGEVLIKVESCGFCYHDYLVMLGLLRRGVKDHVVLGHEISGTIVDVGDQVLDVSVGARVVTLLTNACGICTRCRNGLEHRCLYGAGIGHGCDGGLAEFLVVKQSSVVLIGESISFSEAALLACPIGVVVRGVKEIAKVSAGEFVVVTGAGGGLGAHAVQVATALGAEVLALTSSPDKVPFLEGLGASLVLETGVDRFDKDQTGMRFEIANTIGELVRCYTEEKGADVVIDTVGEPLFDVALKALGQYGRLLLLGQVSGQNISFNPAEVIFLDAQIFGCSGCSRSDVIYANQMIEQSMVKPVIYTELRLEEWKTAFDYLKRSKSLGRVVFILG